MLTTITEHVFEKIEERFKEVRRASTRSASGRVYLPTGLVGSQITYLTREEFYSLRKELLRLKAVKRFFEHLLNSKNHSKMFSVVSETWNPVTGCTHNCVYCWARALATTKLRNSIRYRNGFLPRLNLGEFERRFSGGFVFVSDMGDLFCGEVPDEWILKVLEHVGRFPNTYFLFLTKNPSRYLEFTRKFPPNAVLGATIETDSDALYLESRPPISRAPPPSARYRAMAELDWSMKFVSVEPVLDFDLERFTKWIREIDPFMVYVGYDNYGHKLPEPPMEKTLRLVETLSEFTLVVKKTIRPAWYERDSL
ncbi:MAG: DUF5131 family protein [Nanopusillaceae archaeon]